MHLALYILLFSHLTFECEMQHTDNINEGIPPLCIPQYLIRS